MSLPKQLARKKAAITKKWVELVINSYPAETARFLQRQSDPFANPVGQTTKHGLQSLIDILLGDLSPDQVEGALDPIIRIRAIQDFTPGRAVRFVFDLKHIIRAVCADDIGDAQGIREIVALEKQIDEMGFTAFDIYMRCREKIYDLKANEIKDRTFKAFARAGLVKEPPEDGDGS
jgi:RsbT co-antagonist protein rsbRD N-terminal domain